MDFTGINTVLWRLYDQDGDGFLEPNEVARILTFLVKVQDFGAFIDGALAIRNCS